MLLVSLSIYRVIFFIDGESALKRCNLMHQKARRVKKPAVATSDCKFTSRVALRDRRQLLGAFNASLTPPQKYFYFQQVRSGVQPKRPCHIVSHDAPGMRTVDLGTSWIDSRIELDPAADRHALALTLCKGSRIGIVTLLPLRHGCVIAF